LWYWNKCGAPVFTVVEKEGGATRPDAMVCSPMRGGTPVGHWLTLACRPAPAAGVPFPAAALARGREAATDPAERWRRAKAGAAAAALPGSEAASGI
jgi:hypothetical protein